MSIEVKNIQDLVSEYVSEVGTVSGFSLHKAWPEIAGKELVGITEFSGVDEGKINVIVKSPAAYSLLMLRKRSILSGYSRCFPEMKITGMHVKRAY